MDIHEAAKKISGVDYVISTRVWDRVPGMERIYITTQKFNGGKNWNCGVGYSTLYVDVNRHSVVAAGEAGAATRKRLVDTLEVIKEIAQQIKMGDVQ